MNCVNQARVLLAYDPRQARAWLRDFTPTTDPSMGLILCSRHAEVTSVPMSWTLVDERVPGVADNDDSDITAPSFDDIFPPRSHGRRDPWASDGADWHKEPSLEDDYSDDESDEDTVSGIEVAPLLIDDDDFLDYDESEAVRAESFPEELPASGTDGVAIPQPRLPMTGTGYPGSSSRIDFF